MTLNAGSVIKSLVFILFLIPIVIWSLAVSYYNTPFPCCPSLITIILAVIYLSLVLIRRRFSYLVVCSIGLFVIALIYFLSIQPTHNAAWQPAVSKLPKATITGDTVFIENVRNFIYQGVDDYIVNYETRNYDLSQLQTLDLFISYWGSPYIAHTILSFGFADGQYLALSVETRMKEGQSYSPVRGFFKNFELIYIPADEEDLIKLRTNFRGEDVYLYRLNASKDMVRKLFLRDIGRINEISARPEFYDALRRNCTTNIYADMKIVDPQARFNWRIIVNGLLPELLYNRGVIKRHGSLLETINRARINERANREGDGLVRFSEAIRDHL